MGAEVPLSVLLAEDDDDLRKLLAETLRSAGFQVRECPNGLLLAEIIVGMLEKREPMAHVVVSDVRMPGVTGLSVLEGLSRWEPQGRLPVVLITAFGDPNLQRRAERLGAVTLLEKPFEMAALLQVVRSAIAEKTSPATIDPASVDVEIEEL